MIVKTTTDLVMDLLFSNPTKEYHLRELSRNLNLSMSAIISATDKLAKSNLITKQKTQLLTKVKANIENQKFIRLKRVNNIYQIYNSDLIDYLIKSYNRPQLIILFGSYSRGEDIEISDLDLAIVTKRKINNLLLKKYKTYFNREIRIHEIDLAKISAEFRNNLYNGIVLEGSW